MVWLLLPCFEKWLCQVISTFSNPKLCIPSNFSSSAGWWRLLRWIYPEIWCWSFNCTGLARSKTQFVLLETTHSDRKTLFFPELRKQFHEFIAASISTLDCLFVNDGYRFVFILSDQYLIKWPSAPKTLGVQGNVFWTGAKMSRAHICISVRRSYPGSC